MASSGIHSGSIFEKHKFCKEVLERKAISNIEKLRTRSEYRMWTIKLKNEHAQVRLYARKTALWLDSVKERDVLAEMEVRHINMTAMEAIVEPSNIERANVMKGGEAKHEGTCQKI